MSRRIVTPMALLCLAAACDPGSSESGDRNPPSAPTLSAYVRSSTTIRLMWSVSTDDSGVAGYRVYRAGAPFHDTQLLLYDDLGLTPSTTYCYTVRAYDGAGNESAPSTERCATTPATTSTLTVMKGGTGTGTVTSSPAGISCGTTCSASYTSGTSVTLTAAAATGSTFTSWSGCTSSSGTTCTVSMMANATVIAAFTPTPTIPALTVVKSGTGSGTVTSSPAGISCGATCSASYASGTSVTLTAAAGTGSTFTSWAGCTSSSGTSCTVSMTASKTVTATFTTTPANPTLTVAKAGTGSGTVTSSPTGISCGATCSASYASGTSVTLTAAAATGSDFTGWTNCDALILSGGCKMAVNANKTVTANFTLQTSTTKTFSTQASNVVVYSNYDNSANQVFQNYYPSVGINTAVNLATTLVDGYAAAIKFDVSTLAGKTIDSAVLNLEAKSVPVGSSPTNFKVGTFASAWSPATLTWNSMGSLLYYAATWQSFAYPTYGGQVYAIDVKQTVAAWAAGTWANNGMGIESTSYTPLSGVISFDQYSFWGPTLTVTYH